MKSPLDTTFRFIRCSPAVPEEAVDLDAMREADDEEGKPLRKLVEYFKTRDESLLAFREGATPTWFVARRLPAAFLAGVVDALHNPADRRIMAVRAGIHTLEGATSMRVVPPGQKGVYVAAKADCGVTLAPDEWVQELADLFGADTLAELGEVVLTFSRLPRGARGPFGWWGGTALSG